MSLVRTFAAGTVTLAAASFILVSATAMSYVRGISEKLPDHMKLASWEPERGTVILASDGSILGHHARERRKFVPIEEVPPLVVNAFIAAEDGGYWTHSGIDPLSIARALLTNIRDGGKTRPEGGSTITQQVVKNVLLSPERTLDRKVKEAILAVRSDRDIGKDRILEIYLNEIYFGAGAYGVAAAAETYFGKDLGDLALHEAALLAGLPKAPSAANPFTNPGKASERRSYVLSRMVEEGFIGNSERQAALEAPLPRGSGAVTAAVEDPAMWFPQEEVRRTLVGEVGAEALYGKGGEIQTTVLPAMQRIVHSELRRALVEEDRKGGWRGPIATGITVGGNVDWQSPSLAAPPGAEDWQIGVVMETGRDAAILTRSGETVLKGRSLSWATRHNRADSVLNPGDAVLLADFGHGPELVQIPEVQGAVVVLDPRDGTVLAMDGGFSHESSEFNRAVQAHRQTGSVFKPFVYLAAVEAGYDAMSPVLDSPIAIDQGSGYGDWRPGKGREGLGLITLRRSLEMSRNMSTVRLLYDLGMEQVRDVAFRAGFKLPGDAGYAMALGAAEATPLDVAKAYAALANGGFAVQPTLIDARKPEPVRVFDPVAVAQLSSMLEGVVTSGTAKKAFLGFDRPLAAKTGTTNDSRDVWFAAYGPDLVVVAWIGRDDHKPLARGASGGGSAAPMVRAILDRSEGVAGLGTFTLPEGASTVLVDRETGMPDPHGNVLEIVRE